MSFLKASLKLVLQTDEMLENGNYKMKNKSFSNVKRDVNTDDLAQVGIAMANLQKHSLQEVQMTVTSVIG